LSGSESASRRICAARSDLAGIFWRGICFWPFFYSSCGKQVPPF
jgi:hypothetical protein